MSLSLSESVGIFHLPSQSFIAMLEAINKGVSILETSITLTMCSQMSGEATAPDAAQLAHSIDVGVRQAYGHSMLCCGQLFVEHDISFGYLRQSSLQSAEQVASVLCSKYRRHLTAFQNASDALTSFNQSFAQLLSVSGLDTTGDQMCGYFLGGPLDQLLRALRHALSYDGDVLVDRDELAERVNKWASELKNALSLDSENELEQVYKAAERLSRSSHESFEQVAAAMNLISVRRDIKAVTFVALALAGWEPDLYCWEKNIASLIRGERALIGEYRLPIPLERRVQKDILVGASLDRKDTYRTLDGSSLRRVETLHIGQDSKGKYVETNKQLGEAFVGSLWAPFERTSTVGWETMKEFVDQTGPVRFEWTSAIKRTKNMAQACVPMDGMEVGKAFLSMSDSVKIGSPNLFKIWQKTMTQRSFTALTCGIATLSAGRTAVIERMVLSMVTAETSFDIPSHPMRLKLQGGTAELTDGDGARVYVDDFMRLFDDTDVAETAVKFFALLTRAMDGWIIKPGFYENRVRQKSVLRAKGPREGFDRDHETQSETSAARAWRSMCQSPFGSQSQD